MVDKGVHIFDVNQKADRRASDRLGAAVSHLRELVGEHDGRIAYFDLGMADLATGARHSKQFGGSEGLLIKLNGAGGVIEDQVWSHGSIPIGNRLDTACHNPSS